MFVDFLTLALDQLVNQAAKAHFMSGGQLRVPLVLRTQGGAGQRGGAQHSQSLEAWLTHVPGLKVAMPSTAADAAGLLVAAIADPNPVVFVENKTLYFRRERVANGRAPVPLGRARVVRAGRDVTVVALSRLVHEALAAAEELAADGIEVEVIDPRTLVPLDLETIVESVARTHRLVVAHEAVVHGGFGAELAAQVQAAAFDELDAPIERVGAPFAPVPFSPPLEDAYLPGRAEVAAAVRRGRGTLMPKRSRCSGSARPEAGSPPTWLAAGVEVRGFDPDGRDVAGARPRPRRAGRGRRGRRRAQRQLAPRPRSAPQRRPCPPWARRSSTRT